MAECTRCGDCCTGFPLNTPERADIYARRRLANEGRKGAKQTTLAENRKQFAWMAQLVPISGPDKYTITKEDGTKRIEWRWLYSCPIFDPVTRLCTDHANRPRVCSQFPWYGRDPKEDSYKNLPPRCSFVEATGDVKMLPIVEVRHGRADGRGEGLRRGAA